MNQQWWSTSMSNGRYQVVNRATGTAVDGTGNATAGSTVGTWAPDGSTHLQWTVTAV